MTDSVRIPQLHLFGTYRPHRSPTRDFIQFQSYKASRRTDRISLSPYCTLQRKLPIPVPVPVPIPIQPIIKPIYELPLPYPPPPPIAVDYVRAPSTYLTYAQQYLMGYHGPTISPIETGRFNRSLQNSRRNINQQTISKKAYLNNKTVRYQAETKKQQKPQPKKSQPTKIIVTPPAPVKPSPSPPRSQQTKKSIIKDPYLIPTDRQNQKQQIHKNVNLITITQNQSLYISQPKSQPVPKIYTSDQATQTLQQNNSNVNPKKQSPQVNKSSIILQKFMRSIPHTIDEQTFKTIMKKRLDQFYSISINFQDMPIIDIDDLIEMKDQYMEYSRDLLVRLNQLAGDRVESSLIYKLFKTKQKGEILWPNIS